MALEQGRLGAVTGLGTDYTIVGAAVPTGETFNMLISVTNVTSSSVLLRAYIATADWADHATDGEPDGSELVARIAYDFELAAFETVDITGRVLLADEKLVVRSDTAASLDVIVSGLGGTP